MIFNIRNSFLISTLNSLRGKYLFIFIVICILSISEGLLLSASFTGIIPIIDVLTNNKINQNAVWPISFILNLSSLKLHTILIIFSCSIFAKVLLSLLNLLMSTYLKISLWDKWQKNIIRKQLTADYDLWKKDNRGRIINNLSNEIKAASAYIFSFSNLINKIFLILMLIFSMMLVNFKVVFLFFFLILCVSLLTQPFINKSVILSKKAIKFNANYISIVSQMVNSLRDIRLLKIEKIVFKDINYSNNIVLKNNAILSIFQSLPKLLVEVVVGIFFLFIGLYILFSTSSRAIYL